MAEKLTLARPYAKAAFEYADQHNELVAWRDSLCELACLMRNPDIMELATSPAVTSQDVVAVICKAMGNNINAHLRNFVSLLAEYHRLLLLPEISQLFSLYVAKRERTIDVEVISAYSMSDSMQAKLSDSLEKHLELGVFLKCSVDAELIGGAIIRAGDFVIDGSVRSQLKRLHTELIS